MPASDAGLRTASDSDRMPDRGQILIRDGTFAEQSACRIVRALTCPGTLNNKNLIRSATICRLWAVHGGCLFLRQIFPDPLKKILPGFLAKKYFSGSLQKCKNTSRVPCKKAKILPGFLAKMQKILPGSLAKMQKYFSVLGHLCYNGGCVCSAESCGLL